ncbi:MAG: hypothetical protein II656_06040 [Ruminococcus sp.]|nr:hypothetical protein [Ruminococcus sp.]
MDSNTWRNISYILLISGIVFLILTIILAIKFQLLSMIKAELNHKKKKTNSDNRDYFEYVENKNRNNIEAISGSERSGFTEKTTAARKAVPPPIVDETPATVVISSAKKKVQPANIDATVLTRRNTEQNENEFIITENIIVIHGDPDIVSV